MPGGVRRPAGWLGEPRADLSRVKVIVAAEKRGLGILAGARPRGAAIVLPDSAGAVQKVNVDLAVVDFHGGLLLVDEPSYEPSNLPCQHKKCDRKEKRSLASAAQV